MTADPKSVRYSALMPGDPAPRFHQRSTTNRNYAFDAAAGRYIVLCFLASASDPAARAAIDAVETHRALFDDERACFFGITQDPGDQQQGRLRGSLPGIRYFWDFDAKIAKAYGLTAEAAEPGAITILRLWFVLDPTLRIMAIFPFTTEAGGSAEVLAYLQGLPPPSRFAGMDIQPPILVLPGVFEPAVCERLVALHRAHGGEPSGFMRDVAGKTTLIHNPAHKRRRDITVTDEPLIKHIQTRVQRCIAPELLRIHFFAATRMERYLVACYTAEEAGHFAAHRDNTTRGTAHRRFAVTINLNDDYDGGDLRFPEYGPRGFRPPVGAALVFSCSLMHMVTPVTRGERYAFLPFLYDEAAAKLRQENLSYLADDLAR
jgi:predicted 2-oxoglutarate/Fe(II)-dependent dioxygenase YbiX/peroxiredoxin